MKTKIVVALGILALAAVGSAQARPQPINEYGAKKISVAQQWVKGFKAPAPSYLDRRK